MIGIKINNTWLALPIDFTIEYELNNPSFDEGFEIGSVSLPTDIPIYGNEISLGFVHELNTANKITEYNDVLIYFENTFWYRAKMTILKTFYPTHLKVAFAITDFFSQVGDITLPEIEYPSQFLGNTDAAILATAHSSIDGSKIYCFPPMQADGFYNGVGDLPTTVSVNSHTGTTYETNVNLSKPLCPWFSLPKLLKVVLEYFDYQVVGEVFKSSELDAIKVSNMRSLENDKNENDFSIELKDLATGEDESYAVWSTYNPANFAFANQQYKIEENLPFLFTYKFHIPPQQRTWSGAGYVGVLIDYKIEVRLLLWDGYDPATATEVYSDTLYDIPSPGAKLYSQKITYNHNTQAADVGKYFILQANSSELYVQGFTDSFGIPTVQPGYGTIYNENVYRLPIDKLEIDVRYTGVTGNEFLPSYLNIERFLPDLSVADFISNLRQDFNFRFEFDPQQKQIAVNFNKSFMDLPIRDISTKLIDIYEADFQSIGKSYAFTQVQDNISEETRKENEAKLTNLTNIGTFNTVADLPTPVLGSYAIVGESNSVYIATLVLPSSVFGSYTVNWQLSHTLSTTTTAGDTSDDTTVIKTYFQPINAAETLIFNGIGKSAAIPDPSNDKFYMCNFLGTLTPDVKLYPTLYDKSLSGVPLRALRLNYDETISNSIYGFCWKEWIDFLNKLTPIEVEFTDSAASEQYSFSEFLKFNNSVFVLKQIKQEMKSNGEKRLQATLLKIN